jgi:diguanylate cyclase (GGDEF)-like protein
MTVAGSGRRSTLSLVLCVVALAGLGYLAWTSETHPLIVGLLVAIPLFAAIFLPPGLTALVGILVLGTAGTLAALVPDTTLADYTVPLIAVGVSVVVAIVSAVVRRPKRAAEPSPFATGADVSGQIEPDPVVDIAGLRAPSSIDCDPMTGLLNRGGAIRALGRSNGEADRVLAFLDCDLLRVVNQSYGAQIGDEFLQAIAGRLRHSLPAQDTVARWDGDEFLVVFAADPDSAMPSLERVVGSINGHPIRTGAGPVEASMSVGAAVWRSGQDLEEAISRAGRAVHSAKATGRGRIVLDSGTPAGGPVVDGGGSD